MIPALGYSLDNFRPDRPGRLCRGRERWIEPWEPEGEARILSRLVVSGARFSDDSARDAQRGLPFSGLDVATVIMTLFPRKTLLAFMEDGHGADIPEGAEGVEAYSGYRAGGAQSEPMVRWYKRVNGVRELRQLLGTDSAEISRKAARDEPNDGLMQVTGLDRVRGFLVLNGEEEIESLMEHLFPLVGLSSLDSPPARYQPGALPDLAQRVKAIVLMHRDKHGPALGIYSLEPLKVESKLEALCEKENLLAVPFAIPPMLARWDRALADLRTRWIATKEVEFPVPPAPEPSGWEPRRGRYRDWRENETSPESLEEPVPGSEE